MANSFTPNEQREIKRRLWEGETQTSVAEDIGMSTSSMARVVAGTMWADTPWPDGSTDEMSEMQRRNIARQRFARTNKKNRHFTQAMHMERADRLQHEKNLDRRRAIRHLAQDGELNPTESQIIDMMVDIREADLRSDEEVARLQEEAHRTHMQKVAEEQAEYEREMAKLPPDVETDDDRDNRLCRDLWEIGTLKLRKEVADQISYKKLVWLMEMNVDQPGVFLQLKPYLEERKHAEQNSANTGTDQG